jgi:phosphoribosylformimino-5-aminoimidazole carboxamide ribotide isomerase
MQIIPVVDLMNGRAVHARRGRRAEYRPLESPLCRSAEPRAVIEGLLRLYPFRTFYLADLDALMGKASQSERIDELRRAFPQVEFWIDSGGSEPAGRGDHARAAPAVPVLGSESLDEANWHSLLKECASPFVLSLDVLDGNLLGPADLLRQPELWPERIILMSLSRVGSGEGPDFGRAAAFRRRHPDRSFIVGGGVRDAGDLERLETMGMAAVLMASALHAGTVDSRVLGRFG